MTDIGGKEKYDEGVKVIEQKEKSGKRKKWEENQLNPKNTKTKLL